MKEALTKTFGNFCILFGIGFLLYARFSEAHLTDAEFFLQYWHMILSITVTVVCGVYLVGSSKDQPKH